MSLFQCAVCGCIENTALSLQGVGTLMWDIFDWTGIEDREGKLLCSEHIPANFKSGKPSGYGVWHGQFEQRYLPIGKFVTNRAGNLQHKDTVDEDIKKYLISRPFISKESPSKDL